MIKEILSFLTNRLSITLFFLSFSYLQINYLKIKVSYYKHKLDKYEKNIKKLQKKLKELENENKFLHAKLSACELSNNDLKLKIDILIKQKDDLVSKIIKLKQENTKLKKYKMLNITNTSIKIEVNPDDEISKVFNNN